MKPPNGGFLVQIVRGLAAVKKMGEGKIGGKLSAHSTQKREIVVEKDAAKLVSHCCGLNYFKEGSDPKLGKDADYPEWLFKMYVDRKATPIDQLDKDSWEYWRRVVKATAVKKHQNRRF